MEFKCDDDVGNIFFIFLEFSSKCMIELSTTFDQSPNETLALLYKPRKQRSAAKIIALMCDKSV